MSQNSRQGHSQTEGVIRYGFSRLQWGRLKCTAWVQKHKCPKCHAKRLQPGPDYDRFRVTCWNCGYQFRAKPPTEALRSQPLNLARIGAQRKRKHDLSLQ